MAEHPDGQVDAHDRGAASDQPPAALRGPAADLEHPTPSHVTEQPDVGLIESFRTPDEAGRARLVATEEAPVLGKVCVGIAVPPPPVGRGRRGRPVADRAAVIRFVRYAVHVAHQRSPSSRLTLIDDRPYPCQCAVGLCRLNGAGALVSQRPGSRPGTVVRAPAAVPSAPCPPVLVSRRSGPSALPTSHPGRSPPPYDECYRRTTRDCSFPDCGRPQSGKEQSRVVRR